MNKLSVHALAQVIQYGLLFVFTSNAIIVKRHSRSITVSFQPPATVHLSNYPNVKEFSIGSRKPIVTKSNWQLR